MEIRGAEQYRESIRFFEGWGYEHGSALLDYWLRSIEAYLEADCDDTFLTEYCGSLGEFGSGADKLCHWIATQDEDPQVLWDAFLEIENALDGEGQGSRVISQKLNRAAPMVRRILDRQEVPRGRTPTDEKILAAIDKYGFVESQSDLLDKLSEDGEIMDVGTAKPRLSEMKANHILVAWKGNRGYKRPT